MKQDIKIPEGYKNSPLGVIPEEWKVKKLETIFSFKNGMNFEKEKYGDGIKFINTMDVLGSAFMTNRSLRGSVSISNEQQKEFAVVNGDVLFNRTSETRKEIGHASVYIDTQKAVFGGFIIRAHDLVNSIYIDFKQYCFNVFYVRKQISSLGNGAIRYNIGQKDLSTVSVLLPPFPEQQKIAEILTTWDKAIEKQTQLINLLEQRKQGLMQQLLTGKKRLKGFTDKWETVKLEKLFTERNEINNDNLPLLSITGEKGIIYQSDSEKRDISNGNKFKYKRICPNDIGYNTMRMWQGRSALSKFEGIVSPAYTVVIPQNNINVLFMSMLIKQPRVIYDFWTHSQGLVNDTLNCKFKDFKKVKVIIPTKEEQITITKILTEANNEINLAKQKVENFRQQKKGLMQVLLTGIKRVKLNKN